MPHGFSPPSRPRCRDAGDAVPYAPTAVHRVHPIHTEHPAAQPPGVRLSKNLPGYKYRREG